MKTVMIICGGQLIARKEATPEEIREWQRAGFICVER